MAFVEMNRREGGIAQVRGGTHVGHRTRRIPAIAIVLDGHSRRLAAQAGGIDWQTPRPRGACILRA